MNSLVLGLVAVWILLVPQPSEAQKVYRVGALIASDLFVPVFEGFKKKLAELGYQEGKNIHYDLQNAKADEGTSQRLAIKIVRDKPDVIVTSSTTATANVVKASTGVNIPVVFLNVGNPLEFVKSYASSGNNLTGVSAATLELTAKRLELLKELVPGMKRVLALNNPNGLNYREYAAAVREGAKRLDFKIVEIDVTSEKELERVTATITRKMADAIVSQPDPVISRKMELVIKQSIKAKLPMVSTLISSVKRGGLATYAPDYFVLGQQGAVLVDKIFKGARPTDLPIEQPFKLMLVINLKTAKAIGLKIPKEILIRADELIE